MRIISFTNFLTLAFFVLITSITIAQPTPPSNKRWEKQSNLSDEFDAWDDSKWWKPLWNYGEPVNMRAQNSGVSSGNLWIRATLGSGPRWFNTSRVMSFAQIKFPMYTECKIKSAHISAYTTYWLNNGNISNRDEIDICENNSKPSISNQNSYRPYTMYSQYFIVNNNNTERAHGDFDNRNLSNDNPAKGKKWNEDYQVLGCWWKDAHNIQFYINGEPAGSVRSNRSFTRDQNIIWDLWTSSASWVGGLPPQSDLNNDDINAMYVDWIHTYKLVDGPSTPVAVTGVNITPISLTLPTGASTSLTASVLPSNASNSSVSWSSSNTAVATVNSSGVITTVAPGNTTIMVTSVDGSFTATSAITVILPGPASSFTIEAENFNRTGGTFNDGVVPLGVNATAIGVNFVNAGDWAEYDLNVTTDGVYSIEYAISTPSNNAAIEILVDGISFSNNAVPNNGEWDSYQALGASGSIYLASGAHIIRIVGTGANDWQWNLEKMTFSSAGSTTPVTGITVTPESVVLEEGQTYSLAAIVLPLDATDQSVTWSSSNSSVVTVDSDGVVSAVAAGDASVTVTTADGGFTAISDVTVTSAPSSNTIIIEAESFNRTGGTYNDGTVPLGVNATAVNINFVNAGDWAEYDINVTTGGVYSIEYAISTPSNHAVIQLLVDVVSASEDNVPNNGEWDNFQSLTASGSMTLTSGAHVIRVVGSGSNAWQWNLDKITLTSTGNNTAAPDTTALESVNDAYLHGTTNDPSSTTRKDAGTSQGQITNLKSPTLIYPNPASQGEFTLDINGHYQEVHVRIYDHLGKLKYGIKTGEGNLDFRLTDFKKGLYLMRISSEDKTEVLKLLIK